MRFPHLLILLAACAPAERDVTAVIDTLPSGTIEVNNLGPSEWTDTNGWRFIAEQVIAPAPGSPGEIGSPDGLAMDRQGRIYVIQRQPHTIKVFDVDGTFLRDISREGEGPGEFTVGYIGVFGDTLALQDPGTSRFTTFLADGTLLQTHPSVCCWATSYLDIDENGLVAVPGSIGDAGAGLLRFRLDGTLIDTIALPPDPEPSVWWHASWTANGRKWNMRIPGPLQPARHERYGGAGVLVHGVTDSAVLIVSRTGRDTARIIRSTIPRQPITPAIGDSIFAAHLAGMGWQPEWLVDGGRGDVPAEWPPWTTFSVDRAGRIWLGIPGPTGRVTTAQVFDSAGVLLGSVPMPRPDLLDGAWGNDRIAILDSDDAGYPLVRVYRLARDH